MAETVKKKRGRPKKLRLEVEPSSLHQEATQEAAPTIVEAQGPLPIDGTRRAPDLELPGPQKLSKLERLLKRIKVRDFKEGDILFVNEVRAQWKLTALSKRDFEGIALVAENSHGPAGFIWAGVLPDGTAFIQNLGVSKKQTRGTMGSRPNRVGLALILSIFDRLQKEKVRRICCTVQHGNTHLLALATRIFGADSYDGLHHIFVKGT